MAEGLKLYTKTGELIYVEKTKQPSFDCKSRKWNSREVTIDGVKNIFYFECKAGVWYKVKWNDNWYKLPRLDNSIRDFKGVGDLGEYFTSFGINSSAWTKKTSIMA